jgi:hypothetical protein
MATPAVTPVRHEPVARTEAAHPLGNGNILTRPWALALALAIPLAIVYLVWSPPAADLSAAIYRSDLFARVGYTLRDNGWYAVHGHYLLGYSLLSPALGALLGVRTLLALSVVVASALFGLIAERAFGLAAGRAAAVVFTFGICDELLSGRVPYDLGIAVGLGSVLALMGGQLVAALVLAALCSAASPVAGAFLALVYFTWGLAVWSAGRSSASVAPSGKSASAGPPAADQPEPSSIPWVWPLALTIAALAPITVLAVAFPEGGYEPFAPSSFWPALAGVLLIALLLPQGSLSPRGHRAVRIGAALYALALIGAFAIKTPVGGNAARLGPELAPALLVGVLWNQRRKALWLIAPVLLYWQVNTPIGDLSLISGQQSANASYYAPLLAELRTLRHGVPTIVEVPLTATHAEAAYVAGHDGVKLARGWERQLDTRYGGLFYRSNLTASAYRAWLQENHVYYVALPDASLDYAGRAEGALVAHGLPYLHEVWRSKHWRLYVLDASSR